MHVPFCDVRCPYCHFTCFVNRDTALFDRWAASVAAQFARMREHFGVERLASVYFGGGTPTALTPSARESVTGWLARDLVPLLPPGAEITLECNPESSWEESLAPWVEAGANRLSLGLQSMDADVLEFLGRLNTPESNRRVLDLACGLVDNVSIDLIVASPRDSATSLHASIEEVLRWPVSHVSAYLLEFHAATRFGRDLVSGRIVPTPDEEQARTYAGLVERLEAAGLRAYELSNFARPGREAVHNQRYWTRDPYLGVGPSAHSNVEAWRWAEVRETADWVRGVEAGEIRIEDLERLSAEDVAEERILLGLRRREGVDEALLGARERLVEEFVRAGLLRRSGGKVAATTEGWLLLDQIVARLAA